MFDLEKRAEELFRPEARGLLTASDANNSAIRLAREFAAAIAEELHERGASVDGYQAAEIVSRYAQPEASAQAQAQAHAADTLDGLSTPYEQDTMSHEKPGAAGTADTSGKVEQAFSAHAKPSQPPQAPLSDADVLERAAAILERDGCTRTSPEELRSVAAGRRMR